MPHVRIPGLHARNATLDGNTVALEMVHPDEAAATLEQAGLVGVTDRTLTGRLGVFSRVVVRGWSFATADGRRVVCGLAARERDEMIGDATPLDASAGPGDIVLLHSPSGCCHEEVPIYLAAWQRATDRVDRARERPADPDGVGARAVRLDQEGDLSVHDDRRRDSTIRREPRGDPTGSSTRAARPGRSIGSHSTARSTEIANTGGFLYGVTVDASGAVYGCDMGRGEIVRVANGEVTTYSAGTAEHPLRVPNFSAFDDAGNLYVTDSGDWGADDGLLFRVAPGGETAVWSSEVPAFPNGCCLTAEGDALLVVESHARRVVRVPIETEGAAGDPVRRRRSRRVAARRHRLATDGTMFVGCYRPDLVWRVPPSGAPERWAEDPDGVAINQPANPVFIGEGLDRLLMTSLGGWNLVAADGVPAGLPLRYPAL